MWENGLRGQYRRRLLVWLFWFVWRSGKKSNDECVCSRCALTKREHIDYESRGDKSFLTLKKPIQLFSAERLREMFRSKEWGVSGEKCQTTQSSGAKYSQICHDHCPRRMTFYVTMKPWIFILFKVFLNFWKIEFIYKFIKFRMRFTPVNTCQIPNQKNLKNLKNR